MAISRQKALIQCAEVELTLKDILVEAKIGEASAWVRDLAICRIFARRARQQNISIPADELAAALAEFYAERELFDKKQATNWRKRQRLTEPNLRDCLQERLLAEKWRSVLAGAAAVEKQYRENVPDYLRAFCEIRICPNEGVAREIMLATSEGERPWQYDDLRVVYRREAPEEIAAALFSVSPGELVGPLETEEGNFEIWRPVRKKEPVLDDELRQAIRDQIIQREIANLGSTLTLEFRA
jgi:hypothetical protein